MSKYRKKKRSAIKPYVTVILGALLVLGGFIYLFSELSMLSLSTSFRDGFFVDTGEDNGNKTLTIFTTVMAADDDPLRYIAQENCLALLSELKSTNVIVFTDDREWIRISKSYGIHVSTSIDSNEFGTPYLRAMYQYAFDHFQSDFYGYVNADILLDSTVIASLRSLKQDMDAGVLGDRIYAVGQRTNVQQELEDKFVKGGEMNADDFVIQTLMKGHRYWDSAVDYHIVTRNAFDWDTMPDFVIGRSGYDLYLVQEGYLDAGITMVDMTNTVHCAHMLSRDGNRSGLKRQTPDRDWNQRLLHSIPGGCCQFKSFGKLANRHTVQLTEQSICVANHTFEGYYDDSYYDTEKVFIQRAMRGMVAQNCFIVSENDILGVLLPYCKQLTVIIINRDACERTFQRLKGCGVEIQLGCNYQQVSPRELVLSMFQKIDTNFDLVLIQSEKPLVMIKWIEHKIPMDGVLIMRRWLDPVERREIQKALGSSFELIGTVEAPPEFDATHDEHFGMAGFRKMR